MSASASQAHSGTRRSGKGVHHWWVQRVTSVALIPLSVWFLISVVALPAHDYTTVVTWLAQKWTAALFAIFIAVAAWHSHLGLEVILEDYVEGRRLRLFSITLSRLAHVFVTILMALAVLRIAFGAFA